MHIYNAANFKLYVTELIYKCAFGGLSYKYKTYHTTPKNTIACTHDLLLANHNIDLFESISILKFCFRTILILYKFILYFERLAYE
jgi:hypothetical protein